MAQPIYLVLENGSHFQGEAFGADVDEVMGEVVFTTGMTGYLETLTDPSYCGQIVVQTFPLIGNYGVIEEDFESRGIFLQAYIVREWCQHPSNFRCGGDIDTFLKQKGIPGLFGIDTRCLTRIIRQSGTMNGMITKAAPPYSKEVLEKIKNDTCASPVKTVSRGAVETVSAADPKKRVALWDFGAKQNMVRALVKRGCEVTIVPSSATAEEILSFRPDGILLSNGPGDPTDNPEVIAELKKLTAAKLPMFGICLGHQLLALATGAKTEKLKYGHRGANQPVRDMQSGRVYITSQNHGYAVCSDTLKDGAELLFENVNDNSCEGIRYTNMPAFSVQFHPEACGGPKDTDYLFDRFMALMKD